LGALRLHEELKAGRPTLPVFRDLIRDAGTAQAGPFLGACSEALRLLADAQARRVRFKCRDAQAQAILNKSPSQLAIDANRLLAARDWIGLSAMLMAWSAGLDGIRGMIDFNPKPARRSGKPTATSEPIPVKIVGQVPRMATTKIKRNGAGDIIESFQLHEDVLQPDEASQ
jgi:hypothetical protein